MRNLLIAGILMLFATGAACAQTTPKTEFFVGYEYQHLNPGGRGCQGLGLNLAYNLNDWLGGVGDFGLCRETGLPSGASAHDINYLFGPRLTYRTEGKWNPFGQVLLGGKHLGTNVGTADRSRPALHLVRPRKSVSKKAKGRRKIPSAFLLNRRGFLRFIR